MSSSIHQDTAIPNSRGFTLIETLIAAAIIVTGLVAVASMFAYSARTNLLTQQRTTATLLATSKLEELRSYGSLSDPALAIDGSLTIDDPGHFDYITIGSDGSITSATTRGANSTYVRRWQVSGTDPVVIQVAVYALVGGLSTDETMLVQLDTNLTGGFSSGI